MKKAITILLFLSTIFAADRTIFVEFFSATW